MSTLIIDKVPIESVEPAINSDFLDVVKVYDWRVVTQRGRYKVGDEVIYIPVDTQLTPELEALLFPPTSKIQLNNRRIKTIKLRKNLSQGLIVDPNLFPLDFIRTNVIKWETPVKELPSHMSVKTSKKIVNPTFVKYTDIENIKYFERTLEAYDEVVCTQKLHGTSARYSWEPTPTNTLWKKVLNLLKILPKYEFCYGSRMVQLQDKLFYTGYYSENIYNKILKQYNLKNIIPKGYGVYGEIVGSSIQKGYLYNCKNNEHEFYVYDVRKNGKWLDYDEAVSLCDFWGLKVVPEIYRGEFKKDIIESLLSHNRISPEVNEGLVIKPIKEEYSNTLGRVILKWINPEYYLNQEKIEGTDFH